MSLPNWQWFRTIDISGGANNDADWADEPETYTASTIASHIINVPMDIGNDRDIGLKQLSIYAVCVTSAGALVNRGSMTFDLTPIEVASPDPSGTNSATAHPTALIEGATTSTEPNEKATLNIGPVVTRLALRVSNMASVPGSADELRLYWRPGA